MDDSNWLKTKTSLSPAEFGVVIRLRSKKIILAFEKGRPERLKDTRRRDHTEFPNLFCQASIPPERFLTFLKPAISRIIQACPLRQ